MKKVILIYLCFILCLSCKSQERSDLEMVDFSKNYKEILKGANIKTEAREIVSALPIAYTKDVNLFNFGNVSFLKSPKEAVKSSSVGILINNTTERLTKGIKIEVEDTDSGRELFDYLKLKYKEPKTLTQIPKKNNEGKVLGNSAYSWSLKDKTMVFVQYYEYTNNKPNISSVLYVINNNVESPEFDETVATHIIKTYTP